jgi:hypothetical protein
MASPPVDGLVGGGSASDVWRRRDGWLLALTLVALAAVPWTVRHWPSQDGPNHLAVAHLLRHFHDAGSPFPRYFDAQGGVRPSTLYYAVLVALADAVSLETAQKIAVSLAVVLLPLAGFAFVRRVAPARWPAAFLLLPLAIDWSVAMGFVSFVLALPFGILALALAFDADEPSKPNPPARGRHAAAAALFFVCVLFHPVTGVLTGLALLFLEGPRLGRLGSWVRVACVTAPAALFLIASYVRAGSGPSGALAAPATTEWSDPFQVLCGVVLYHVAYSPWEIAPRGAVMLLLLGLAVKEARRRRLREWLHRTDAESAALRVVAGLLLLYAVLPSVLSDWYYCSPRALIYASVLLPAVAPWPAGWAPSASALGAALTAVVLGLQLPRITHLSEQVQEVIDAGVDLPRGAKLVPLHFGSSSWSPIDRPQPLAHAWAMLVLDHDAVAAQFFAAGRPRMGGDRFRTLTFRPGVLAPAGDLPWSSNEGASEIVLACRDPASALAAERPPTGKCAETLAARKTALDKVAERYDAVLLITPPDFARAALARGFTLLRHVGIAWMYAVPHPTVAAGDAERRSQ